MKIYNLTGQAVRDLTPSSDPSSQEKGRVGSFTWDGRDDNGRRLAGGIYICRLQAGGQTVSRKLVYVR